MGTFAAEKTRTSVAGIVTIFVFAALSVASGSSKSSDGTASTASTGSAAPGSDPLKTAKLIGSCDRSDSFHLDCTESYEPSVSNDDKGECDTLGGKWRLTTCPRINAITQCCEGNAPYLSCNYDYVGTKTKKEKSDCPRAFADWTNTPQLKPNTQPASCNAVAGGGTCSQYTGVTLDVEKDCLDSGGAIKQPPEGCPTANGMEGLRIPLKDGTVETEFYYSSPYKDATGSHTWKEDDVALICGLAAAAGAGCSKVPMSQAGSFGASGSAAPSSSAPPAKASAKPGAKPASSAKPAHH